MQPSTVKVLSTVVVLLIIRYFFQLTLILQMATLDALLQSTLLMKIEC